MIVPTKRDEIDLTLTVRGHPNICDDFFLVHRAASLEDVETAVGRALAGGTGWRQMTASDLQHITDRVSSFSESERLYFGNGYVLGLKSKVVSEMTPEELTEFFEAFMKGAMSVSAIAFKVAVRKVGSTVLARAGEFRDADPISVPATVQFATLSLAARLNGLIMPKLLAHAKNWAEYQELRYEEQARLVAESIWQECSKASATSAVMTNLTPNQRKALAIVSRFGTADAAIDRIVECLLSNRRTVLSIVEEVKEFMPNQVMTIADSAMWMDGNPDLVKRLASTFDSIVPANAPHYRKK